MGGGNCRQAKLPHALDGFRNDLLIPAREVKPAHDGMEWLTGKAVLGMLEDIDHPGMRAGREYDQAFVLDVSGDPALIHEQWIRFPAAIYRLPVLPRKAAGAGPGCPE